MGKLMDGDVFSSISKIEVNLGAIMTYLKPVIEEAECILFGRATCWLNDSGSKTPCPFIPIVSGEEPRVLWDVSG